MRAKCRRLFSEISSDSISSELLDARARCVIHAEPLENASTCGAVAQPSGSCNVGLNCTSGSRALHDDGCALNS